MRAALLAILLTALVVAGCSAKKTSSDAPSGVGTQTSTGNTTLSSYKGTLVPTSARYNNSFDLTVTFASGAAGIGTNFGQPNCVQFAGVKGAQGNATATWSQSGTPTLELVGIDANTGQRIRIEGASPLTLPFNYAHLNQGFAISVQSPGQGAVAQVPVHLTLAFDHPYGDSDEEHTIVCAF